MSGKKLTAAIVGPGNIGTDLLYKLLRSDVIEPRWMIGVDPASEGLRLAADKGLVASLRRGRRLAAQAGRAARPALRGDLGHTCTASTAPRYEAAGIRAIDLTPAAVGPAVVPPVEPA